MTVTEIIRAAGGRVAVAESLHLTPWAIDKWGKGGIPEKYWPVIQNLADGRVGLKDLHAANVAARASEAA